MGSLPREEVERLLEEIIASQQEKLLSCAQRIIPEIIQDDLYQPNDYPALENHPLFRYEEGILHGLQMIQAALRALNNR
jgi:hypothetical protein